MGGYWFISSEGRGLGEGLLFNRSAHSARPVREYVSGIWYSGVRVSGCCFLLLGFVFLLMLAFRLHKLLNFAELWFREPYSHTTPYLKNRAERLPFCLRRSRLCQTLVPGGIFAHDPHT